MSVCLLSENNQIVHLQQSDWIRPVADIRQIIPTVVALTEIGGVVNSVRISLWIQVATSIAVLVGLGLVLVEIRQTHSLARTEIGSAGFDLLFQRWNTNIGEDFAVARTKACVSPDELSDIELTELRHYYLVTFVHINRQKVLQEFGEFEYDWESTAEYEFGELFKEQPARAWFKSSKDSLNGVSAEIVRIGERVIDTTSADCAIGFKQYRDASRITERVENVEGE